ncbi:MAG: hypothetical protein ABI765_01140 [Gemmatimonadota bacterium]
MPAESFADLARRPDGPTVDQIWAALLPGERQQALQQYLASDKPNRQMLDAAAATLPALRTFRKQTIQQMPDGKLVDVVAKATRLPAGILPDLLLAMHVKGRTAMLESFLDTLGVPHEHGVITDADAVGQAVQGERLSNAAARLGEQYPARDVQIYLLTLLAMDPNSWGGLRAVVARQAT